MFDKPSIFEPPAGPALTASTDYPVDIEMPVSVQSRRVTESGSVVVASLPWGLDYDLAEDTFEVMEADPTED